MVIRKNYESSLELLQQKLIYMGSLVEVALGNAIESLQKQDIQLADEVIEGDSYINELELEIEELVVTIIASQQPVATDLRHIMSVLKIVASLERIGDFGEDIAIVTKRIGTDELIKPLLDIPEMAKITQKMICEVLNAYIDRDAELAKQVAALDDEIDAMYATTIQELTEKATGAPSKLDQVLLLAFVARYIERIADYVTNIAEGIVYTVEGTREDLNQ